ncbi:MAG: hypothetical protein R2757_00225 [Draconibacterium sp.]
MGHQLCHITIIRTVQKHAAEAGMTLLHLNVSAEYLETSSSRSREHLNSVFSRVSYGYNNRFNTSLSMKLTALLLYLRTQMEVFSRHFGRICFKRRMLQRKDWISIIKLRTSYGLTGNNSVGRYDYQGLWALNMLYNGEAAGIPYTGTK